MAQSFTGRKRVRKSFGRIPNITSMPNLIEVQKSSYDSFLMMHIPPEERGDVGLKFRADLGPGKTADGLLQCRDARMFGRKRRIGGHAGLGAAALKRRQDAQGVLGREGFCFGEFGRVAHCSRHPLSLARPRRTQLFTVPSGVSIRRARAS